MFSRRCCWPATNPAQASRPRQPINFQPLLLWYWRSVQTLRPGCTSKASQAFWSVHDVDGLIRALKARGVVFENYDMPGERSAEGAVTAGGAKAAWFKDSEGNIMALGLLQNVARTGGRDGRPAAPMPVAPSSAAACV